MKTPLHMESPIDPTNTLSGDNPGPPPLDSEMRLPIHSARPRPLPDESQVLIVGGGPAGLAAAIALRQRGIDCVVAEALSPNIDKACGEGLMPDSLEILARLGVHLDPSNGHPIHGIRFADAQHTVEAGFPDAPGLGIRRPRLHALLAARAEELGAHLLWNTRAELPAPESTDRIAHLNGHPLRFRWLIGADGQGSSIRRHAGLDAVRKQSLRYGFRTHYRIAPWTHHVEIHWAPAGQLYITPVASDCVCVVYLTRDRGADRANLLDQFPHIAARLHAAEVISPPRGAVSVTRKLRRVATRDTALIGDASGSADSITGEGLAMSFRQAHALAAAIDSGSLAPYRRAHRQIARLPHAMGALMLTLDRSPAFQARALSALAANPHLFQDLLAAHMGHKILAAVALRRAPAFGWTLLTNPASA